ncbi:MAG TPA: quinone oxidoreductase [Candidatus Omnitrophota bacterium]|nr:quinone oxidoreductase [Candidatus Omnitrophota bacterium]
MTKAIRIHQTGGPEVMRWEEVDLPDPGPGQALVRQTAIGVNFIDVYHRTGLYPAPLPATLGMEGAGVVEAVGEGVVEIAVGDRVAYAAGPIGAYAERRLIPAHRLVALPEGVEERQAAAIMLKGMTAQYLLRRTYPVRPGDTILVQAAAGGVGLLLCQWAKHLGATVIGTVGSEDKAALAKAHGCDHAIVYTTEDFVVRTRALTDGRGVDVVYDSVGAQTFMGSLDCLRPLGMLVAFGQSSGKVPPFDAGLLGQKGSLFLTRPSLFDYTAARQDLVSTAMELFDMVKRGFIKVEINHTYALADAAQAHRDLENRKTTGSSLLLP